MKENSFKNQLFRSIYTHPDECFDPISEHCHPKMKDKGLAILVFRSIATHLVPLIAFRSIATQSNATSLYLCALNLTGNKLMHKTMAGKITEMSKLKQILQLHESGVSNRSIASQLGIYKETVNKYIRQFKTLSVGVKELLEKDEPELERIFNGGALLNRNSQNIPIVMKAIRLKAMAVIWCFSVRVAASPLL